MHSAGSTSGSGGLVGACLRHKGKILSAGGLTALGAPDGDKPADQLAQLKAEAAGGTVFDKREEVPNAPVTADASFANGTWSVTLSSPLKPGAPFADLAPGKTYTIGFAIHSGHTERRFHYVSLERTLELDRGNADFIAVNQ